MFTMMLSARIGGGEFLFWRNATELMVMRSCEIGWRGVVGHGVVGHEEFTFDFDQFVTALANVCDSRKVAVENHIGTTECFFINHRDENNHLYVQYVHRCGDTWDITRKEARGLLVGITTLWP